MTTPQRFIVAVMAVALGALPALIHATPPAPDAPPVDATPFDYHLRARAVAPDVYVVEGVNADFAPANGCNIINTGFIVTDAGVLVINTGPSLRYGEQLRALIARTTRAPVRQVIHLNQHPDYFLGNQAFADVPRAATPVTRAGMADEGGAYLDNLYRLCGDWMKGTELRLADTDVTPGVMPLGGHDIELIELHGHTRSDLVLIDRSRGVMFAGGLVFSQRIPTTPHAEIPAWLDSLHQLALRPERIVVPSHGVVDRGRDGVEGTASYLHWLDQTLRAAAERGDDMNDVLRLPPPAVFSTWAAWHTEYVRNVAHLYPRYEQAALGARR